MENDYTDYIATWNSYIANQVRLAWEVYWSSPCRQTIPHPIKKEGGRVPTPIPHSPDKLAKNIAEHAETGVLVRSLQKTYNEPPDWFYDAWMNGVRDF
jgi:hypothetical protein